MPFFSVVIPLYNKQNYIAGTIESVLGQDFSDFELIIVEDCSTDSSAAMVETFDSPKLRMIRHEKNKGLSAARNTGIRNANAEYIAFLDADDQWHPQFLSEISSLIDKNPDASLFATCYEEIYPGNVSLRPRFNCEIANGIVTDFFECNLGQPIYCPSSLCVQKSVFSEIGYYDEAITFGEDVDFNIRANVVFRLAWSAKSLAYYRMHSENQITNSTIGNKTITDFDSYEDLAFSNKPLKKYLDFHRYIMAKHYRNEGNELMFAKMLDGISHSGLNLRQRILLRLPAVALRSIKIWKNMLLRMGIKPTSYS